MNERMKALQDKVLADAYQKQQGMDWAMEKFAELIVRECMEQNKVAIQSLKNEPENIPGWKTCLNLAQVTCRNQIQKHFGVE